MAASNARFTQNRLGQSKNPIDSDHGIYRDQRTQAPVRDVSALSPPARLLSATLVAHEKDGHRDADPSCEKLYACRA
jgi:hypothetical protein